MLKKIISATFLLFFISSSAHATGLFLTNGYTLITPLEEKAAIIFDQGKETLIVSPIIAFNPLLDSNVIWLTAVPSKPTVELVPNRLFPELEPLAPREDGCCHRPDSTYRPINVMFAETFGPGEVTNRMKNWLANEGVFIPKNLERSLQDYGDKGWHFVAALVNLTHVTQSSLEVFDISAGQVLPIKITFDTDTIIYPQRMAAIQDDRDSIPVPYPFGYGEKTGISLLERTPLITTAIAKEPYRQYPGIPTQHFSYRSEVFVLDSKPVTSEGFIRLSTGSVYGSRGLPSSWHRSSLDLPTKRLSVSRLVRRDFMSNLTDHTFTPDSVLPSLTSDVSIPLYPAITMVIAASALIGVRFISNAPTRRIFTLGIFILSIAFVSVINHSGSSGKETSLDYCGG